MDPEPDVERTARNREVWSFVNAEFTDGDAEVRWAETDITWGLFRLPEHELGLLGDLAGSRVVELGCGTAYFSSWLARAGARPIAVDLSRAQLATARQCQDRSGITFPLVEADGEHVPLRSGSFDLVVSEYGAGPWCDPNRWLPEAARLLRPGGRLVFLTNSVLAGLCVPEDEGFAGDRLLRPQRDLFRIEWPSGGVEHHPGHGDWIRLLGEAGFVVDALHELYPPAGATTHEHYDIVTASWADRWPAEDLWVAHLATPDDPRVRVVVVGAHLEGEPLNHQLTDRGAVLVERTRTAASYRLYALAGTSPPKPGLRRVDVEGAPIEVEVWELPAAGFGTFVAEIPPPLGLGKLELAGGRWECGFICEDHAFAGAEDITAHGGWRAYRAATP